jgi:hypothetical protein
MRCLFHPDMLALHRRCLGTHDVYMDNCQSNNKAAPQSGGPWHVHGTGAAGSGRYGEACDDVGPLMDPAEYMKQPCVNVMLVRGPRRSFAAPTIVASQFIVHPRRNLYGYCSPVHEGSGVCLLAGLT